MKSLVTIFSKFITGADFKPILIIFEMIINTIYNLNIMALKTGPKRIADSTGKPDRRQRDNKETPGNTPSLLPPKKQQGKK